MAPWRQYQVTERSGRRLYQGALDETRDDTGSQSLIRAGLDRFVPPMDKRLARLEAMGGQLARRPEAPLVPQRPRPQSVGGWVKAALRWTVGAVVGVVLLALMAFCGLTILVLLLGLVYLAVLFEVLLVALPVLLVNVWLR